jgi:RNA polymerase sigma-70 factor (ECF subfamily)
MSFMNPPSRPSGDQQAHPGNGNPAMTAVSALSPLLVHSDEELLARCAAGAREALDELFRRYRLVAYRVAYRLLGNEADALDAVQEGFVKVLTHLESFQGRSTFKTWLLRVVSNAALDLGRQRGRREVLSLDAPEVSEGDWPQPPADDPAAGLERQDMRHLLDQALATLPDAQRRTFVLHAEAELSYREVAEVMGISIGTVMSRLYYARQKLRSYLSRRVQI